MTEALLNCSGALVSTLGMRITVTAPSQVNVVNDNTFFPREVRTRVAENRAHPHGGPPGRCGPLRETAFDAAYILTRLGRAG